MRLAAIITLGLLSRTFPLGYILWDKYLGDALYAAMVYELIRLCFHGPLLRTALIALAAMAAIETFQLTMIPARLASSEAVLLRWSGRLLGTHFSVLDLLAYVAGIGAAVRFDGRLQYRPSP